jgi:hypothetical protein
MSANLFIVLPSGWLVNIRTMRATGSRFSRRLSFVECRLGIDPNQGRGAVAIVAVRVAAGRVLGVQCARVSHSADAFAFISTCVSG